MPKILIIDDEDQVRKMLKQLLESNSYDTVEARNGIEGLELFKTAIPDLVLTDLIMPEKEGLETIREMKKLNPGTKIIAISGGGINKPDMYLDLASKLGAQHVFSKPVKNQELLSVIKKMVG